MSEYTEKRALYLKGEISHLEFYLWTAAKCGIGWTDKNYMGHSVEWWAKKYQADSSLNNVPLAKFDALYYPWYMNTATKAGVGNAPSDCVCTHKAVISAKVLEYLKEGK